MKTSNNGLRKVIKEINNQNVFKFYISETNLENSFSLFRRDTSLACVIKLFTINSLSTSNEAFCREAQSWLESSISRSILLTGASERERFKFFNSIQQKIDGLMSKMKCSFEDLYADISAVTRFYNCCYY
ncbi:MAG: hypothetical protein HC830_09635 [Bacteroidetes bacterium]|nr:hypothetical protein [Bacteroidota bacterium]